MDDSSKYDLVPPTASVYLSRRATREDEALVARCRTSTAEVRAVDILECVARHSAAVRSADQFKTGLGVSQQAYETMLEAEKTLPPRQLELYRRFHDEVLAHSFRDLVWLGDLGAQRVASILRGSSEWRDLPPRQKGLSRKVLEAVFGEIRPWD